MLINIKSIYLCISWIEEKGIDVCLGSIHWGLIAKKGIIILLFSTETYCFEQKFNLKVHISLLYYFLV